MLKKIVQEKQDINPSDSKGLHKLVKRIKPEGKIDEEVTEVT
jgi:hypothetical protein